MLNESLKNLYHRHAIPPQIMELHELEAKLNEQELTLHMIGLSPSTEFYSYAITPPDCIPFAETGGNGIHFGFLTDFSEVKSLEEAPIVCVSPTNDPPIRYVARDITEFLNLVASLPHAEMIEEFWGYENETLIQQSVAEFLNGTLPDWVVNRKSVHALFQETFHPHSLALLPYLQEVRQERAQTVVIETYDGLGVLSAEQQETGNRYAFNDQFTVDAAELARMQQFLQKATRLEQLAFIRDVNYRYVVSPSDGVDLFRLVVDQLQKLELEAEVESMLART